MAQLESGKAERGSVLNFEIKTYQVYLASRIALSGVPQDAYATIECKGANGETLLLHFMHESDTLPENEFNPRMKEGTCYAPAQNYPWFVDLLRNERPVYGYMNRVTPQWNRIHTGAEPVGEGEKAPEARTMVVQGTPMRR